MHWLNTAHKNWTEFTLWLLKSYNVKPFYILDGNVFIHTFLSVAGTRQDSRNSFHKVKMPVNRQKCTWKYTCVHSFICCLAFNLWCVELKRNAEVCFTSFNFVLVFDYTSGWTWTNDNSTDSVTFLKITFLFLFRSLNQTCFFVLLNGTVINVHRNVYGKIKFTFIACFLQVFSVRVTSNINLKLLVN